MGVAAPQQHADQMSTLAVEDAQRMVDVLLVVAVVVATFLITVGGICSRIEVQKHLLRSAIFAPLPHVESQERLSYSVARAPRGCVLEPRDGGLAC